MKLRIIVDENLPNLLPMEKSYNTLVLVFLKIEGKKKNVLDAKTLFSNKWLLNVEYNVLSMMDVNTVIFTSNREKTACFSASTVLANLIRI